MPNIIDSFRGPFRWLSNFQESPVILDGQTYPTVEHAYQAAKNQSEMYRQRILECQTPAAARVLGQTCILRRDWLDVRLTIMRELICQKFSPGSELGHKLGATADQLLIERNTWGDQFWGVCNGVGANRLGQLLMERRAELVEDGWRESASRDLLTIEADLVERGFKRQGVTTAYQFEVGLAYPFVKLSAIVRVSTMQAEPFLLEILDYTPNQEDLTRVHGALIRSHSTAYEQLIRTVDTFLAGFNIATKRILDALPER